MARERKFSTKELFQTTKQSLIELGYDGFTFSLLADKLNVARGTLYKYYENKDELISSFLVFEMNEFLLELKQIDTIKGFKRQFDFLLSLIFNHHEVQHFLGMTHQLAKEANEKVKVNIEKLNMQHLEMYKHLESFIHLGKKEKYLKSEIPDGLLLGFIFQSIAIPNHFGVPHAEWVENIKHIICHGMFTDN